MTRAEFQWLRRVAEVRRISLEELVRSELPIAGDDVVPVVSRGLRSVPPLAS